MIAPHFEYCNTLKFNYSQDEMNKMRKVQNRAMRLVLGVKKYTNIKLMLETLGWLRIKQRVIFNRCILIYKMINNLIPEYLNDYFVLRNSKHSYNTRGGNLIDIKIPKLILLKRVLFMKDLNYVTIFL